MYPKHNLFRLLLLICVFCSSGNLNAFVYDNDVLDIFSKTLPRLILMSSQKEKVKNSLEICLLYETVDERSALALVEKINSNYPHGINKRPIKLVTSSYSDMEPCKQSQLIFMFNAEDTTIKKALEFSAKHSLMTVAYDKRLLEKGVGISLFLGRKVSPYFNVKALHRNKVEMDNVLLRISKIYEGEIN